MFEIQSTSFMDKMIGSWVDVLEFAKRWESFTKLEKDILTQIGVFTGTYAELAAEIDYESKYANHESFEIKFALTHLIKLGLVEWNITTCTYTVLPMPELINKILEI